MTSTSMWWRHAHFAIRQSRDVSDLTWADYEPKNLEILSSWTRDQQKLETKLLDSWLSWMEQHHIWQPIHVRGRLHQKSFPDLMNEWMDVFQMNPKAICADRTFHRPNDMQAIYRIHNVERLPIGPHTSWPIRADMGVRLFKKFPSALLDTVFKKLDETLHLSSHLLCWCVKQQPWETHR